MNVAPPLPASAAPGASLARLLAKAFLENAPDAVYFKDRESRFIAVSRSMAHYLGCDTPQQVVGRTDYDFFSADRARQVSDDEQRVLRTGQPIVGRLERETWPNGRTSWVLTTKMPLRDQEGRIVGTFGVSKDVTKKKETEQALEKAHKDLVGASRIAGMAEVATGVLHNVGNVLNSLNVSASVIATGLRQSKADSLVKLAALLREHQADLARFLTDDPKGRRVPEFLAAIAQHTLEERERLQQEVVALQKNVDHIKEIVAMQQAYATMVGVIEPLDPVMLMDDALRMNVSALQRHDVRVVRDFQFVSAVLGERAKVLQILVNLVSNAKYACDKQGAADKVITLRIAAVDGDRAHLSVEDNGIGIPPENLTRIFQHGFTTRVDGHGFGLHSSANAAREMNGSLVARSPGVGRGASFTLELPIAPPSVPAP
ncbi:MAG TPA: PAS domain-containing protein [Opitutaceae bacterium]|nr:PAS domain-containing protein [Opitutaceae bacterium]